MDSTMRLGFGILVAGLVGLVAAPAALAAEGGHKSRTTADAVTASEVPEAAQRLLTLVNRERATAGAPPLALRGDLVSLAAGFSRQMAAERDIRHNTDFLSAASAARLGASLLGENVAVEPAVETAHARLMESPGHRANILEPAFRFAGFAVVQGDEGSLYVTEDFLAPGGPRATKAAPAAPRPPAPRPRPNAAPARPSQQPSSPRPTTTTTPTTTPAGPADDVAAAPAPPATPVPASVSKMLATVPIVEVAGGGGAHSSGGGRHDPASFQVLVVGSAVALTRRRSR